jgi:hypothetical protein
MNNLELAGGGYEDGRSEALPPSFRDGPEGDVWVSSAVAAQYADTPRVPTWPYRARGPLGNTMGSDKKLYVTGRAVFRRGAWQVWPGAQD